MASALLDRDLVRGSTPQQMAAAAQEALRAEADPGRAAQAARYFPSRPPIVGAPSGMARELGAELARELGRMAEATDLSIVAETLYATGVMEDGACANEMLGRLWRCFSETDWDRFEGWVSHFTCWATTDSFGLKVLGPLVLRDGPPVERLERWTGASCHWQRRAALVSVIPAVRKGLHLGVTWPMLERLLVDPHEMVQKAVGWTLKEASKADTGAVIGFVQDHRGRMTRLAMRHALQRMSAEQRALARD